MDNITDFRKVALNDPYIDIKKIERLNAFREALEKAGLYEKADYFLSPALRPVHDKEARQNLNTKIGFHVF